MKKRAPNTKHRASVMREVRSLAKGVAKRIKRSYRKHPL